MTYEKTSSERIAKLRSQGFISDFIWKDDKFQLADTKKAYSSDQIEIIQQFRFEGISNPADMSILYAIETDDNKKGIIEVPYGPYGNTELAEFFTAVEEEVKN